MTRIGLGLTHFDDAILAADVTVAQDRADRARRYVAGQAHDATDARQLLEALGLIDYRETP